MDEQNNQNLENAQIDGTGETPIVGDGSIETTGFAVPPTPKKKPKMLLAGIIAAVAVVVTVVAAFGINAALNSPQKVVMAALDNVNTQLALRQEQMAKDFPYTAKIVELQKGGVTGNFKFAIDTLTLPGTNALIGAALSGSSLEGTVVTDAAAGAGTLDMKLFAMQQELLTLSGAVDKNELQFSVPTLSPRVFSVKTATFLEDFEKSVLSGGVTFTDEEKATLKSQLDSAFGMTVAGSDDMVTELGLAAAELNGMLRNAFIEGGIKKLDSSAAGTRYNVLITAENSKKLVDSIVEKLISTQMGTRLLETYESQAALDPTFAQAYQAMKDDLAEITFSDTTIIFTVKDRGLVGFSLEGTATGLDLNPTKVQVNYTSTDEERTTVDITPEGENGSISMVILSSYADKHQQVEVTSTFKDGNGTEQAGVLCTVSMDGSQPENTIDMNMSMSMGDSTYRSTVDMVLSGTATVSGDTVTLDYPEISMSVKVPGMDEIAVSISSNVAYAPTTETIVLTPGELILKMTESELNNVGTEYLLAMMKHPVFGQLIGQMLGIA